MMGFVVPAALVFACALLGAWAYSLYRRERAERRDRALDQRDLYAAGQAVAAASPRWPLSALAAALHEAGIDAPAALWLAQALAVTLLACVLVTVLAASLPAGALAGGMVAITLCARVAVLRKRRAALLGRQLVRALPQVAASVRGSLTLERAIRTVAAHTDDPLREELARVLADAAYGAPLAKALEGMALRTGSVDVKALAAAVRIQQRFGGAIAPVLDMIAAHANARLKTQRELKTELAGTQLAKWFVAASMPAIFLIMFATNTDFARFYAQEPLGWALLLAAAVAEAFGLMACQRITKVGKEDA